MMGHPAFAGALDVAGDMFDRQADGTRYAFGTFGLGELEIFEALVMERRSSSPAKALRRQKQP